MFSPTNPRALPGLVPRALAPSTLVNLAYLLGYNWGVVGAGAWPWLVLLSVSSLGSRELGEAECGAVQRILLREKVVGQHLPLVSHGLVHAHRFFEDFLGTLNILPCITKPVN